MTIITDTLDMLKEQTGIGLVPCDYFSGIRESPKGQYFNVDIGEPVFSSSIYDKLIRFSASKRLIDVEPNGAQRLAIFPRIQGN